MGGSSSFRVSHQKLLSRFGHTQNSDSALATREWARLAIDWYTHELGSDSEQIQAMRATLSKPESHFAWGTREPMDVRGPLIDHDDVSVLDDYLLISSAHFCMIEVVDVYSAWGHKDPGRTASEDLGLPSDQQGSAQS